MEDNKSSKGHLIGKILKYMVFVIIILVYGIFLLRICTMGNPSSMKKYVWTESMIEFYNKNQSNFEVEKVDEDVMSYQYLTDDGKFAINNIFITKTGNGKAQIQFTVRYNNSTIKSLVQDYMLQENPIGEPFVYIISDSSGTRYRNYQYTNDKKGLYNYRHIVFDDVDISAIDSLNQSFYLYLDIYYIENVKIDSTPYGVLPIYKHDYTEEQKYVGYKTKPYNYKKDMFVNNSPTSGIMPNPAYLIKD